MKDALDFAAINQAALAAFPAVLNRLLPKGKVVGREIVALNPRRADRNLGSFKINRYNGRWCDFATGERGGDRVSLVAYLADVSQGDAARLLAQMLGMENRGALSLMTPRIPSRLSHRPSLRRRRGKTSNPPDAPPTCPLADAGTWSPCAAARLSGRKPDGSWRYATAQDETAFYAARWNEADGKKTFRPISWGERPGWQFEAWPDHRPLFNLPDLVSRPKTPVVICEGEKAGRSAAAAIFPNSIATTSSGGANAAAKTDWTPIAGRSILIWPDHDAAGEKYARVVATILAALDCSVCIIDAKALAAIDPAGGAREPRDKWDAADAMAEWPDLAALRKRAAGLRKAFDPGPAFVSYGIYEMGPDGLHKSKSKRGEARPRRRPANGLPLCLKSLAPAAIRMGAAGANTCVGATVTSGSTSST